MTLEILTSDSLAPLRHGFFTRKGGASSGIYSGLNCGQGSTDQAGIVAVNRARVAEAMQVPVDHLLSLRQVHSCKVVEISEPMAERPTADAMVTKTPGLALGILTADCQPVLFGDVQAGVIGAAHAGWRGALDGILDATLTALEKLGAHRENIKAVIGPSIGQAAYEVGQEYLETFLDHDPQNSRFFASGKDGRYQFDLPGYGLYRLRAAGVGQADYTHHCTYSDTERFYSYRRACHAGEADYGRLISAIRL